MTLIEIIITVAIIGLIMGLSVGVFRDSADSALSEASDRLVGTIKYVYNEAAIKNQYYRMTINMDDQTFSVESSPDPFKISSTQEGTPDENQSAEKNVKEVGADLKSDAPVEGEEETEATPPPPMGSSFSGTSSYLLKPVKLPDGVKIKDVYVAHLDKKIEGGKTAIYFFPNGWVEKAVINLTDEKGETTYSLETFPSSGKTKIRTEYFEYIPEEGEKP